MKKIVSKGLKVFEDHRKIYDLFTQTGEVIDFHKHIQEALLASYIEHADPYYTYNSGCRICVVEFIIKIYAWYDNVYLSA